MKQILLLDPRDDCFSDREIQNIQRAFVGYSLIDRKDFLQTDDFNCGVWVAWVASLWTQHVNLNLEGSKDITEVITDGIRAEGVHDLRNQYAKRPLNVASRANSIWPSGYSEPYSPGEPGFKSHPGH